MERKYILDQLMMGIDLPSEALPGVPLVEIFGEHRVLVENYCGVAAYSNTEISIKTNFGSIKVSGSGLVLARMTCQQLVITGFIESVILCRRS